MTDPCSHRRLSGPLTLDYLGPADRQLADRILAILDDHPGADVMFIEGRLGGTHSRVDLVTIIYQLLDRFQIVRHRGGHWRAGDDRPEGGAVTKETLDRLDGIFEEWKQQQKTGQAAALSLRNG